MADSRTGGYKYIFDSLEQSKFCKRLFPNFLFNSYLADIMKVAKNANISQYNMKSTVDFFLSLSSDHRKGIIKKINYDYRLTEDKNKFLFLFPRVIQYLKTCINGIDGLDKTKNTKFEVDLPIENIFIGLEKQFFNIEFCHPELKDELPERLQGGHVRFVYTPLPGIRLFEHIYAKTNNVAYDDYKQFAVLLHHYNSIGESEWERWNSLIGQDLGKDAEVYNAVSQLQEVKKIKDGYQTLRSDHKPLKLNVPVLFDYSLNNLNTLNLSLFNQGRISISGELTPSQNLVKAFYVYDDDVETPPEELEVCPLKIKHFNLVSQMVCLDEVRNALNIDLSSYNLYRNVFVNKYDINYQEEEIKLKGRSPNEYYAYAIRPSVYQNDFYNWHQLSELKTSCYPTPVVIRNPNNPDQYKLAISSAKLQTNQKMLDNVDLVCDGVSLVRSDDPNIFDTLDVYVKERLTDGLFRTRNSAIGYFFFNEFPNTCKISLVLDSAKYANMLTFKFKLKDKFASAPQHGYLNKKYELIIWRKYINNRITTSGTITPSNVMN